MSLRVLKSAFVGVVATVGFGGVATAQPARFDPGLRAGAAPDLIQVQAGGDMLRRPGGMRPGGGPRGSMGPGGPRGGMGPGGFPGRGGPGGGYAGGYRHRGGYGIGAGVAGLAAGALIGGVIASQAAPAYGYGYGYDGAYAPAPVAVDPSYADAEPMAGGGDQDAYCQQRFKSYDPASGTYLGYDGVRHPCP